MRTRAVVIAILGLLTIAVAGYAYIAVTPPTEPDNGQIQQVKAPEPKVPTVQELLDAVNAERTKVGVQPLILDARLNQSAQAKAEDMTENNYFAHSDANGKHGYSYAYDYNPECRNASENLSWAKYDTPPYLDITKMMNGWINSKPHYEAMINDEYIITGFGISGDKIVEHFCKT